MPPNGGKQTIKNQKSDSTSDSEQHASDALDTLATDVTHDATANEISFASACQAIKDDFVPRFERMFEEIKGVRSDIQLISTRITQAEERIGTNEDDIAALKVANKNTKAELEALTRKVDDLENRGRRSNLRLIGLPEKAEGKDMCGFLAKWIPEALGAKNFAGPLPLLIENAHRVGQFQNTTTHPRPVIMKFLNYADKTKVTAAARRMNSVYYEGKEIMFFPDFSADLLKRRKTYDSVKRLLASIHIPDLRFGIIYPAKLLVTYQGNRRIFNNAPEAEAFAQQLREKGLSDDTP